VETAMNPKLTAIFVGLLVVVGGYIYFFELEDNPAKTGQAAPSIYDREYGEYDVAELEVVGPRRAVHFARTAEMSTQDWEMLRPQAWPSDQIDQVRVNGVAYRLAHLVASQTITGATNLAQYGLAPPELTVTLTISNGKKITLFAGTKTPINDNRYLQNGADEQTVYLVSGVAVAELERLLDKLPVVSAPLPDITTTAVR
jgi:hypothetical protein